MRWVDWMYLMKSVAPSCRNTVADKIYARWSAFTGWKPLATKWMHYAEAEQFNVFHISLLSLSPRWALSPAPPPPGSCAGAGHCVHLTNVFSWPGPRPVVVAVSYSLAQLAKLKRALSVMDTHHILITDKENVHQPIRTIILRQCLLLLTLFYP